MIIPRNSKEFSKSKLYDWIDRNIGMKIDTFSGHTTSIIYLVDMCVSKTFIIIIVHTNDHLLSTHKNHVILF